MGRDRTLTGAAGEHYIAFRLAAMGYALSATAGAIGSIETYAIAAMVPVDWSVPLAMGPGKRNAVPAKAPAKYAREEFQRYPMLRAAHAYSGMHQDTYRRNASKARAESECGGEPALALQRGSL